MTTRPPLPTLSDDPELLLGRVVVHLEHLVVGRVVKVYPAGTYRAPGLTEEDPFVTVPVIELEKGHAFLAKDLSSYIVLEPGACLFHAKIEKQLTEVVEAAIKLGIALGVSADVGMLLLRASFTTQLRWLNQPPDGGD